MSRRGLVGHCRGHFVAQQGGSTAAVALAACRLRQRGRARALHVSLIWAG